MSEKISMPDYAAVGRHYDGKGTDDLNYLSAVDKRIVHHHSGIFECNEYDLSREYREEELLRILGESENRLTRLGAEVLGLKKSRGFDCGCGRGGSSFLLVREYEHNMFGITVSDSQLQYARAMAEQLGITTQTRFDKLNIFYDNIEYKEEFDFIWACESTEYMPDYVQLFQKWHSFLKPGGKALVFAISYRRSRLKSIQNELHMVDKIYETRIGAFHDYLAAAVQNGFKIDDLIGLEEKIIPYYRLRLKSVNRRGSEEALLKGLENGAFKYTLMLFNRD